MNVLSSQRWQNVYTEKDCLVLLQKYVYDYAHYDNYRNDEALYCQRWHWSCQPQRINDSQTQICSPTDGQGSTLSADVGTREWNTGIVPAQQKYQSETRKRGGKALIAARRIVLNSVKTFKINWASFSRTLAAKEKSDCKWKWLCPPSRSAITAGRRVRRIILFY